MKKFIPIVVLLIVATLITVSCRTTQPQPTGMPVPVEIQNARTDVRKARERAIDFESPTYFPSDWEALEARYDEVESVPKTQEGELEIREMVDIYNALAAEYDNLFRKALPLYAQAVEDEIMSKRDELIATGFTNRFPAYLEKADNITLEALEQFEADDFYNARETANKALEEYEILLVGAGVFVKRQEVMDRDFVKYDEENFQKANEIADAAIVEFDAGNREAALKKAEEALDLYRTVLSNGWTVFVVEKRQSTLEERERARADNAHIASRDLYNDAETIFNNAENNFRSGNAVDAGHQYIEAEAMYLIARQDTFERRQRAEAAIRTAEERIEESNEAAIEAERIIEGGIR
jgi:tetratricopeptide (TPR) repeat protein